MKFRQWFDEAAQLVYVGGDDFDGEEDRYTLIDQAWALAKASPVNILSDKELSTVAVVNGSVAGALFTAWNQEEFSFDVVVDPRFQQQGIGKQLIDSAMSEFNWTDFPNKHIKADVVNPNLIPLLTRYGFQKRQEGAGHTIMVYGEEPNEL